MALVVASRWAFWFQLTSCGCEPVGWFNATKQSRERMYAKQQMTNIVLSYGLFLCKAGKLASDPSKRLTLADVNLLYSLNLCQRIHLKADRLDSCRVISFSSSSPSNSNTCIQQPSV